MQLISSCQLLIMQEGFAFSHCTECRAMFILRANVPPERWWLRLKFQFLVARDHAFIFVIVQLVQTFILCFSVHFLLVMVLFRSLDVCYMEFVGSVQHGYVSKRHTLQYLH